MTDDILRTNILEFDSSESCIRYRYLGSCISKRFLDYKMTYRFEDGREILFCVDEPRLVYYLNSFEVVGKMEEENDK